MKKSILALSLALAVSAASALDLGVRGGRFTSSGVDSVGLTVGQTLVGPFGVELAADRSVSKTSYFNKFSALGTYEVAKLGEMSVVAKAGAARVFGVGVTGNAAVAGVGVSVPVAKNVSLTADYSFQRGEKSIAQLNGNGLMVGAKYSF